MSFVSRFVTQKIAVGSGKKKRFIAFFCAFAERKRQRGIGIKRFYFKAQRSKIFICKEHVLSALKHKGAKAQSIAFMTAGKNFFVCQPVTLGLFVAFSQTAVKTIVFAKACKLDKPPYIHIGAVERAADIVGKPKKLAVVNVGGQKGEKFAVV